MFNPEAKLNDIPIVVIDTETTGLHPGLGDRVVEVGAVRFEGWRQVGEFNQMVNPNRPMGEQAAAVVGIYDEDLVDKPPFIDIADDLLTFMEGALLVAHNAPFDANFLSLEFILCDIHQRLPLKEPVLPNPWLCTLQLARRHFHFGRNNLGNVAYKLGAAVGRAHRALNDVYTTAEVLKRMARQLERSHRFYTVADLLHAQGGPIFGPPPPEIELLEPMATAVADKRPLLILYMGESGETERTITPRYVTEHRGEIYIVAYCHLRQAQRTFRLDRIFSATVID